MTTPTSLRALALFAAVFVASCGGSVDSSKDDKGAAHADGEKKGDAPAECVLTDGACPEGCTELTGTPVAEDGCPLSPVVIGCAPLDSAFDDAIGCYVSVETGTIYETPQLYDLPGFRACSESESHQICEDSAPSCELQADGTCPAGCADVRGWPLDEERACFGAIETIGCVEDGVGFPAAIGCQVEIASGTLYATSALYPTQKGFRQCEEGEESEAASTEYCE